MEGGYGFRYEFSLDDEIILRNNWRKLVGVKTFVFHVGTNFIFKPTEGEEEKMGSERLLAALKETSDDDDFCFLMYLRLMDYCLSRDRVDKFTQEAMDYARDIAKHEPGRHVIPVAVDFNVYTLQQQGEAVAAAQDRAIKPEHMVPLYVSAPQLFCEEQGPGISMLLAMHLINLPKIRVENVDEGLELMDVCQICGRVPTLWSQITHLKCNHPFHSHCVIKWLVDNADSPRCPLCGKEEISLRAKKKSKSGDAEGSGKKKRIKGSGKKRK